MTTRWKIILHTNSKTQLLLYSNDELRGIDGIELAVKEEIKRWVEEFTVRYM